jgi:hypothetical protein
MRQPTHPWAPTWILVVLCATGLAAQPDDARAQATKKPNILVIWGG